MGGPEREQIIAAVKALGRRVTVADVATRTGMPLLAANRALNAVASDCRATIQVTNEGNLVYAFAPAFETSYLKSGFTAAMKQLGDKSFQSAYFLLRISFGVTLIASVITVAVLIVVAIIALMNKDGDSGGGDGGGGFDFDLAGLFADAGRFFLWNVSYVDPTFIDFGRPTYESEYEAYKLGKYIPKGQTAKTPNQGFVLNCYSYLFGDGNPNERIEEQKWQLIGEHIRRNNGVTTAEQLACYTGANPKKEEEVLPVLVHFDGQPVVTDTGNIIYQFPGMQVTAATSQDQPLPKYLEEKRWDFSLQPPEHFLSVGIFAILNFVGCLWLLGHMQKIAVLHHYRVLIDYLSIYAAFFLFFPILRYFGLQFINGKTLLRNQKRKSNLPLLEQAKHRKKLVEAHAYAITADPAGSSSNNIVYTTDKDILEQQFDS